MTVLLKSRFAFFGDTFMEGNAAHTAICSLTGDLPIAPVLWEWIVT